MDLVSICIRLNPAKADKCLSFSEYFNNYLDYFLSLNNLLIICVFISLLLLLIFLNDKKDDFYTFIILFLILFIYLSIVSLYPIRLPWVDDWEWIENLYTKEISTIDWLFQKANIHFIFFPKIIFLAIYSFFNSNYYLISITSIGLIFLACLIILNGEKKLSKTSKILIVLLLSSPKIMPNISQFCNIAWFTSLFLVVFFKYFINSKNNYLFLVNSIIILSSPFNFGLSLIIPIYTFLFIYFYDLHIYKKTFYSFLSFISLIIFYISSIKLSSSTESIFSFSLDFINIQFFIVFFGSLGNMFVPWSESFVFIAAIIGIIQIFFISSVLYKEIKDNSVSLIIIKRFIRDNFFIVGGLIFAFLISVTRSDFQSVVAARYAVGSIVFQIGFFMFLFNHIRLSGIQTNLIKLTFVLYYFLSFIVPYQGIHWQIDRYIKSNQTINCFKINDFEKCAKEAYTMVFYNGNWYDFEKFKKVIGIMINDKSRIFSKF